MGYELYITRAGFWAENEGQNISRTEWLSLVEQDTELTIDEQNGPVYFVWGPTSHDFSPWLDWSEGNIYTKNPDKKTLAKMLQIANLLGATVQGSDGETYASLDDYPESQNINERKFDRSTDHNERLPLSLMRERFWNSVQYVVVGVVVLAYVIYDLTSK